MSSAKRSQSKTKNVPPSVMEQSRQELIDNANKVMHEGNVSEAYPLYKQLALRNDADSQTCVVAGLAALTIGKQEDAIIHLKKAVEIDPTNTNASYNLSSAYLNIDQINKAKPILEKLLKDNPHDPDILNDMALVYIHNEEYDEAITTLSNALEIDTNHSASRSNLLQLISDGKCTKEAQAVLDRFKRNPSREKSGCSDCVDEISGKKIAIFASQTSFIGEIARYLSINNEIQYFDNRSVEAIETLMEWADIAWFEWCDQLLIEATKRAKCCTIICRLHSYEVFTDMPSQVQWEKVDHLLFVSEAVQDIFTATFHVDVRQSVIHNGLMIDQYKLTEGREYGKRIASVGYINYKKNPTLLLYAFKKLYEYDNEFTLHVAGTFQDSRIELYFKNFLDRHPLPIQFDGWVSDMPLWYKDKDYILSTSLFESFHYSIAEGMASGLMPLIHDWYGADTLYPSKYLFSDPDSFVALVRRLQSDDRHQLAKDNYCYIKERYDSVSKHKKIGQLLHELVTTVESSTRELSEV